MTKNGYKFVFCWTNQLKNKIKHWLFVLYLKETKNKKIERNSTSRKNEEFEKEKKKILKFQRKMRMIGGGDCIKLTDVA